MKTVGEKGFKKLSYFVLTLVLVITVFFGFQIPKTTFDYNFEEFFPAMSDDSYFFYDHRDTYGSDNDFILIAIENKSGIFDLDFLSQVKQFSQDLAGLKFVQFTRDITQEEEILIYPGNRTAGIPYLSFDEEKLSTDSARIYKNKELVNTLVSANSSALLVYVRHDDKLSKNKGDSLVESIYKVAKNYAFDDIHYAGRTIGQIYYVETMTVEMGNYVGLSMILVVIFLLIAFRSAWGLLIPQVVILGSMVWILGFMAWIGQPINIIMTILPSIMFVVSMSDVIHLVSKYFDLLREGHPKFEAIKTSFKEIGMATFLTSLTTSIGFFSLVFVNVMPIKTFGIYVGIGVLMAFIITFSVLPFLFFFTKPPKMVNNDQKNFWRPLMLRSYKFTILNKRKISYFSLGFIVLLIYGSSLINSNNYLMDDLKPDNEMKMSFDYMDETFGGVRPFEMAIDLKDTAKSLWDVDILKQINGVEEYLQKEYGVDIKISLNQTLKVLNRSSNLGDTTYFKTPTKKSKIRALKRMIKVADEGSFVRLFMDSTENRTRISGTIPDWGNNKVSDLNIGLNHFIQNNTNPEDLQFKLTGTAHLLDLNMNYLSKSLVSGLLFAIILVAIIMGLLYRSFKMVLISLIPNLIPLLVIGAIMGFFGINLKITTAIVFTISFGIAVDDTIHFLSKFKLELNKGKSVPYALKRTIIGTGKAIVLTSGILCSGFLLLLFSDFLGTFYMGLMISITLLFAVLADLFLLPILILYFYGDKKKK